MAITTVRGLALQSSFRDIIRDVHRAVHRHSALVGKVTFYWTVTHMGLQMIFSQLIGKEDENGRIDDRAGADIWFALRSDDTQRIVLLKIAEMKLGKYPIFDELKWAIDRIGELSTYRNDISHVPFALVDGEMTPNKLMADKGRLDRLNNAGHRKLFRAVIHDLHYLGNFLWDLSLYLKYPTRALSFALPDRPLLRAKALVERSPPKKNSRPKQPLKRRSRPRPSPA